MLNTLYVLKLAQLGANTVGILDKDQFEEFKRLSDPLVKWINDNMDPHSRIIIDCDSAVLLDGVASHVTTQYIKD